MKIAVVVQRFGVEVNGGAEVHARTIAHMLAEWAEVEVLTTCALDYRTWADHFPPGLTADGPVAVRRFPVDMPRDPAAFDVLSARVLGARDAGPESEARWMEAQGPRCSALVAHLAEHLDDYGAVVVFTYLYAHALAALEIAGGRAILVPELHEDPPLDLRIYDRVFALPRLLLPNTLEERDLMERRFGTPRERSIVVGLGVDPPPPGADPERFRRRHGVERPYALCVGRIDPSKGSVELVAHHDRYRALSPKGLDLVMLGRAVIDLPDRPWLHAPGFVDDAEKHDAMAGAVCLVAPSRYESLSIAMLEAWSAGVPTLANAQAPVLVGQSRRSGGGLWYRDAREYALSMALLEARPALATALGAQGQRHVRERLSWDQVRLRWREALEAVSASTAAANRPETAGQEYSSNV